MFRPNTIMRLALLLVAVTLVTADGVADSGDNGVADGAVAKCIVENLVAKENFNPALV